MKFLMGERRWGIGIAIEVFRYRSFGKIAIGRSLRYALEKCCRGLVWGNSESDFVRAPPKLDQ
jgi:hypothetical protein